MTVVMTSLVSKFFMSGSQNEMKGHEMADVKKCIEFDTCDDMSGVKDPQQMKDEKRQISQK